MAFSQLLAADGLPRRGSLVVALSMEPVVMSSL
jgi:hypothetical protein